MSQEVREKPFPRLRLNKYLLGCSVSPGKQVHVSSGWKGAIIQAQKYAGLNFTILHTILYSIILYYMIL